MGAPPRYFMRQLMNDGGIERCLAAFPKAVFDIANREIGISRGRSNSAILKQLD